MSKLPSPCAESLGTPSPLESVVLSLDGNNAEFQLEYVTQILSLLGELRQVHFVYESLRFPPVAGGSLLVLQGYREN